MPPSSLFQTFLMAMKNAPERIKNKILSDGNIRVRKMKIIYRQRKIFDTAVNEVTEQVIMMTVNKKTFIMKWR